MSAPYGSTWGAVGGVVARALYEFLLRDTFEAGGDWFKVQFGISTGMLKHPFAKVYDYIADAEANDNVGMTPDGILQVFMRMLEATTEISAYVGKEIADEMFSETIQEALSNAVQYNLGGAVQSILNIWRGSYPLSYDEIDEVITTIEDIDSDIGALLIAQAGSNLPTTQWRMKVGFDRYIEDKLIALRGQLHEIVTRINDMIIWLHERSYTNALRQFDNSLNALNDAYERAIGLIDMICERALARLQELKGELQTVNEWWSYTKEHPEDALVDPDEVYKVALENKLEAEATYNTVTQLLNSIDSTLSQLSIDLSDVVNKVKNVISKCVQVYDNIIWTGQLDVTDVLSKIDEILQKVSAYRHSVNLQTEITYPSVPLYWHYRPESYPGELAPPVVQIEKETVDKVTLSDDVTIVVGEIKIKALDEQVSLSDETTTVLVMREAFEEQVSLSDEVSVEVVPKEQMLFREEWNAQTPPSMYQVYREEWSG